MAGWQPFLMKLFWNRPQMEGDGYASGGTVPKSMGKGSYGVFCLFT